VLGGCRVTGRPFFIYESNELHRSGQEVPVQTFDDVVGQDLRPGPQECHPEAGVLRTPICSAEHVAWANDHGPFLAKASTAWLPRSRRRPCCSVKAVWRPHRGGHRVLEIAGADQQWRWSQVANWRENALYGPRESVQDLHH